MVKLVSLQHCSNLVVMVVIEEAESSYEAHLLLVALPACSAILFVALVYHSTSRATGKLVHMYQVGNCESDFFWSVGSKHGQPDVYSVCSDRLTLGWLQGVIFQPSGSSTPSSAMSRVISSPSNSTSCSQSTGHLYFKSVSCVKMHTDPYIIVMFVDEHLWGTNSNHSRQHIIFLYCPVIFWVILNILVKLFSKVPKVK